MKRLSLVFVVVLLLFLFSACVAPQQPSQAPETDAKTTVTTLPTQIPSYSKYQISDGQATEFDRVINDNPIDKAYQGKEENDQLLSYVDAWKAEYRSSCEKYTAALPQEQQADYEQLQSAWEDNMLAKFALENQIIKYNSIDALLGSAYDSLYLSAICSAYREQAIHVKYLHYLLEVSKKAEEYQSLTFVFQSTNP